LTQRKQKQIRPLLAVIASELDLPDSQR